MKPRDEFPPRKSSVRIARRSYSPMFPLSMATRIIRSAEERSQAVDSVMREGFKKESGLTRETSTEVSQLIFAYYRWLHFLEDARSLSARIEQAYELDEKFSFNPERFSDQDLISKAIPSWISEELEVSADWVREIQRRPLLWIRTRSEFYQEVQRALPDCKVPSIQGCPQTLQYLGASDLYRERLFQEGAFEIQDLSSQTVGAVCAPQPGQTWWDACSGEGGKLLHLSDQMRNQGLIWASDRAEWRLRRLKQRAARAKVFNYRSVLWNGGDVLPTRTRFDGVLLDAPCTGVGTWQRNPHARWSLGPNDVLELAATQKQLLKTVSRSVTPGGRLIYAVCTLTRSETSDVVKDFEHSIPGFVPDSLAAHRVSKGNTSYPDHHLWIWPQDCHSNGMFIAAWRRMTP